jgi:hypothetical protein
MMYRWSLVVASFDRYATSSASVRLRNFARVHIARRVIPVIICIWLVLPIHVPIFYHLRIGGCGIFKGTPPPFPPLFENGLTKLSETFRVDRPRGVEQKLS